MITIMMTINDDDYDNNDVTWWMVIHAEFFYQKEGKEGGDSMHVCQHL